MQMVYSGQGRNAARVKNAAVASTLLVISCVDGFLKNTHGNPLVYVLKDTALIVLLNGYLLYLTLAPLR